MKWKRLKVMEFATVLTGGTPSTAIPEFWQKGEIPWLNSGELNQGIITTCSNFITPAGLKNSSAKMFPKNTVLIALTGATTGVTGYLTFEACGNQSVTGILPSKFHNPKYLYHYISSIRSKILSDAYGGAQKHISQKYVKEIEIPLPPLHIQEQIADTLDKADALRRKDQELLQKYDELAQAIFYDMFGDPVKNEKGWEKVKIRDLATDVKYGTSKPAEETGQFPYLRMNNITYTGELDLGDLKYISASKEEYQKYGVEKGDLIFNRTNSKELVGKTTVIPSDTPMIIAGYLIRVRFNQRTNSIFVASFLNSRHGKAILRNLCKSIIGMANINAQELQEIEIISPPIGLQNEFANRLQKIRELKDKHISSQNFSEMLFEVLLSNSFK